MMKKSGYVWVISLLLLFIVMDGYYQSQSSLVPIWQTEWFLWRMCAVALILLGLMYYRHTRKSRSKELEFEEFKAKVLAEQEKEWKLIAGELHDSIGQNLSAINIFLHQGIRAGNDTEKIEQASELVVETIDEVRRISQKLYPKQIERLGLTVSIQAMTERLGMATGINYTINIDNIDNILSKENEVQMFRIVQEILSNTVKHANAKNASVTIRRAVMFIVTEITDDGQGFSPEMLHKLGFGLINIEERINMIKGTYEFTSEKGQGTKFKITIPIK